MKLILCLVLSLCTAFASAATPYGPGHGGFNRDPDLVGHRLFKVSGPITPQVLQGIARKQPAEFANWCRNRAMAFGYDTSVGDQLYAKIRRGEMSVGESYAGQTIYALSSGATARSSKVLKNLVWSGRTAVIYICVQLDDGKKFAVIKKCGNLELVKAPKETLPGAKPEPGFCPPCPPASAQAQPAAAETPPCTITPPQPGPPTVLAIGYVKPPWLPAPVVNTGRTTISGGAVGVWWQPKYYAPAPQEQETCPPNGPPPPQPPVPPPAVLPCQ